MAPAYANVNTGSGCLVSDSARVLLTGWGLQSWPHTSPPYHKPTKAASAGSRMQQAGQPADAPAQGICLKQVQLNHHCWLTACPRRAAGASRTTARCFVGACRRPCPSCLSKHNSAGGWGAGISTHTTHKARRPANLHTQVLCCRRPSTHITTPNMQGLLPVVCMCGPPACGCTVVQAPSTCA